MEKIILFDGVCSFCNKSVQFIIKRDPKAHFKFASQQSEIGKSILEKYDANQYIDSIVLIENNRCYYKSTAALHICRHLTGFWKLFFIFILIPTPIRDNVYNIIAKNRYNWFGQNESCHLPTQNERERFL